MTEGRFVAGFSKAMGGEGMSSSLFDEVTRTTPRAGRKARETAFFHVALRFLRRSPLRIPAYVSDNQKSMDRNDGV